MQALYYVALSYYYPLFQEDNKDYQIEKETRFVNLYGIGDTIKTQKEYIFISK